MVRSPGRVAGIHRVSINWFGPVRSTEVGCGTDPSMIWVRYGNERICPVRPSDALTREAATGAEEWEQILSRSFVPLSADRLSPSFRGRVSPTTFGVTKVCDVTAGPSGSSVAAGWLTHHTTTCCFPFTCPVRAH